MLVLSRKRNEAVMIGDGIKIVVVEIRDGQVRLGLEADRNIPIHRSEVFDAIQAEKRQAEQQQTEGGEG